MSFDTLHAESQNAAGQLPPRPTAPVKADDVLPPLFHVLQKYSIPGLRPVPAE